VAFAPWSRGYVQIVGGAVTASSCFSPQPAPWPCGWARSMPSARWRHSPHQMWTDGHCVRVSCTSSRPHDRTPVPEKAGANYPRTLTGAAPEMLRQMCEGVNRISSSKLRGWEQVANRRWIRLFFERAIHIYVQCDSIWNAATSDAGWRASV